MRATEFHRQVKLKQLEHLNAKQLCEYFGITEKRLNQMIITIRNNRK